MPANASKLGNGTGVLVKASGVAELILTSCSASISFRL